VGSGDIAWTELEKLRRKLQESEREKERMQREIDELKGGRATSSHSPNGANNFNFLNRTSSAAPMFRALANSSPSFSHPYEGSGRGSNGSLTGAMDRLRQSSRSRTSTLNDDVPPELLIKKEDIQLLGLLGRGSFGEVWRGLYKEEVVAVKVFLSEESDVSSEIKMMAKVSGQKNIIKLVGVVIQDDPFNDPQVAIVTQYMSNGSMYDMLVKQDSGNFRGFSLELLELVNMATMAAHGVMNLHIRGMIHRDLACRNLLVDAQMTVHVCDFGFARVRSKGMSKGFTATNLGPVRWEAPESLKNKEFSEKTDVFSFGVCLYEMFVGREPFRGSTNAAVAYKVLSGERMRIPINVDPIISTIMTSCWAPNPDVRPSVREVYKSLKERHHMLQNEHQELATEMEIVDRMKKGSMLVKVPFNSSTFQKVKNRFFKVSDDLRRLAWFAASKGRIMMGKPAEKHVAFADISDVRVGATSPNFQRYYGQDKFAAVPDIANAAASKSLPDGGAKACFSIFTKDRTIDVICPSLEVMNEWVRGLNLLRARFTLAPNVTPSLRHSSLTMGVGEGGHVKMQINEAIKKYVKDPQSFNEEETLYLKRIVIGRMCFGDSFLKFAHMGKPHERFFRLRRDLKSVLWSGGSQGKKAKFVSLIDVAEVRTMEDLPEDDTVNIKGVKIRSTFAVAAADRLTDTGNLNVRTSGLGFSLVDREGERLLNLIAPNANLLELWLFGFKCILAELPVLYPDEITMSGRNLMSNSQKASIRFRRGSRSGMSGLRPPRLSINSSNGSLPNGRESQDMTPSVTPASTPMSTPVGTPKGTPKGTPNVSRQSSREGGIHSGDDEHHYDMFSDGGYASSLGGGESDDESKGSVSVSNWVSDEEDERDERYGGGGGGGRSSGDEAGYKGGSERHLGRSADFAKMKVKKKKRGIFGLGRRRSSDSKQNI